MKKKIIKTYPDSDVFSRWVNLTEKEFRKVVITLNKIWKNAEVHLEPREKQKISKWGKGS